MKTLHRSMFAAMLLTAFALIAGTSRASAQASNLCCTFDVFVSLSFPCPLPISIKTGWNGNIQSDNISTAGTPVQKSIANCNLGGSNTLDSLSIDGVTWFTPSSTLPWTSPQINACGGCYTITVALNTNGCLGIRLARC